MKRKTLLIAVICCAIMTACENKETENTTNAVAVENNATANSTVEKEEQPTETVAVQTEEVVPETVQPNTEEVIGDIDISADGLTMADMTEQVLGLDIPVYVAEDGSNIAYDGKNFVLLFPSPMYITEYTDNGVRAQTEAIDFVLSVNTNFSDAPDSVNESRNEVKEVAGNYVIISRFVRDTDNAFQKTYNIYNTEDGTSIQMTLTINKENAYLEYDNSLIEEFIPAFEKTIKSNLQ